MYGPQFIFFPPLMFSSLNVIQSLSLVSLFFFRPSLPPRNPGNTFVTTKGTPEIRFANPTPSLSFLLFCGFILLLLRLLAYYMPFLLPLDRHCVFVKPEQDTLHFLWNAIYVPHMYILRSFEPSSVFASFLHILLRRLGIVPSLFPFFLFLIGDPLDPRKPSLRSFPQFPKFAAPCPSLPFPSTRNITPSF